VCIKLCLTADLLHHNYVGHCSSSDVYLICTTFRELSVFLPEMITQLSCTETYVEIEFESGALRTTTPTSAPAGRPETSCISHIQVSQTMDDAHYNFDDHNLYTSSNVISVINSRRITSAGI
jgi:protein subunit release factor A